LCFFVACKELAGVLQGCRSQLSLRPYHSNEPGIRDTEFTAQHASWCRFVKNWPVS